jgi:predicted nucleic acid-binding protein
VTYLVDSDYVADWLKGRNDAVALLSDLADQGLAISIITYGEIYEGIIYGQNPAALANVFRRLLRGVDVLPLNRSTMRRFAAIRGQLRAEGKIIGDPDILIAATALQHGHILVTRNVRDFARIAGLKIHRLEAG